MAAKRRGRVGGAEGERVGVEDRGRRGGERGVDERALGGAGAERRAEGDGGDAAVAEKRGERLGGRRRGGASPRSGGRR